jgi:tetratricopeptide (TPR) repeat protein
MAGAIVGEQINDLIESEQWEKARARIEKALRREPDSHWLLTRLGETYYEERQYKRALALFLKSLAIVADCPLTLWHVAGTLDALGSPAAALRIYTWLVKSKKTASDDPCWESPEWTDALKTDCVFRIGVCFEHLIRKDKAADCFRRYIDLLMAGAAGSYSFDEAMRRLRELGRGNGEAVRDKLRKVADWLRRTSGERGTRTKPPKLDAETLRQLQRA